VHVHQGDCTVSVQCGHSGGGLHRKVVDERCGCGTVTVSKTGTVYFWKILGARMCVGGR
jgi:hypothetical protein